MILLQILEQHVCYALAHITSTHKHHYCVRNSHNPAHRLFLAVVDPLANASENLSLASLSTPGPLPRSMQGYLQPPVSPLESISTNSGVLLAPAATVTRWPA